MSANVVSTGRARVGGFIGGCGGTADGAGVSSLIPFGTFCVIGGSCFMIVDSLAPMGDCAGKPIGETGMRAPRSSLYLSASDFTSEAMPDGTVPVTVRDGPSHMGA